MKEGVCFKVIFDIVWLGNELVINCLRVKELCEININMVEDGYDKDIENGVFLVNDDVRIVGFGYVCWLEYFYEFIMFYYDSLFDNVSGCEFDEGCDKGVFRRSYVVGVVCG